jgi:hypothetical protein
MGTAAGVAATVRWPVWCGQRRSGGSPADGSGRPPPPGCAHCADSSIDELVDDVAIDELVDEQWGNPPMFASIDDVAIDRRTLERLTTLRPPRHTRAPVIVALRRAQRPVWAPGVRILGRPPIIRRRSRTSSIVDRATIAWVRWGGPTERRRSHHRSPGFTRRRGLPSPNRDRRAAPCPAGSGAERAVPGADGRHRPVGRRRIGDISDNDMPPFRRRWRHSHNWRHPSKFADSINEPARTRPNPRNPPRAPDWRHCEARRATNATPPV